MDIVEKILGKFPYGKCFTCGKKAKKRFDGGDETFLCDGCWEDAKNF